MLRIANDAPVDFDTFFCKCQPSLRAIELGQVAQKAVYTHSDQSLEIQAGILREALRLR